MDGPRWRYLVILSYYTPIPTHPTPHASGVTVCLFFFSINGSTSIKAPQASSQMYPNKKKPLLLAWHGMERRRRRKEEAGKAEGVSRQCRSSRVLFVCLFVYNMSGRSEAKREKTSQRGKKRKKKMQVRD